MKNPRDDSKQTSYRIVIVVAAIFLSLVVWNYVEIRGVGDAVRQHALWKKVDEKEAALFEEIKSWDGQLREAHEEERQERRGFRYLYRPCRRKSDLFKVHPGEIYSKSVGTSVSPTRKHWFYLPPGEHRLRVSITKVTRKGDVFPRITPHNYDKLSDECKTEKLAKHDYELKGGQFHEIEFHRESSDEGSTFTGSLNGEVMAETFVGPTKRRPRIHQTPSSCEFVVPNEIWSVQPLGAGVASGHGTVIQKSVVKHSEFEFMLRDKIWNVRLIPDYMLRFNNTAGDGVLVHYRFQLDLEGGPRANITDQVFSMTMMKLLKKAPLDFDRHFECKDGLYFLKPDAPSQLPETSGGEPAAHDRF